MKTNQFILHYVAAGLLAAAMISATPAALATDMVPFNGTVSGTSMLFPPTWSISETRINWEPSPEQQTSIQTLPTQSRVVLPTLVSFTGWPPTATN